MKCKDCAWCCIHFPKSGMQSDGYVCSNYNLPADFLFVELDDDCHFNSVVELDLFDK